MRASGRTAHMLRLHARCIVYFNAVRDFGSIREAARRLNVTPSALTRQIAQMEDEIGSPLFDRLPGGMVLTAVGEIVARHIITVMQDAVRTDEQIAALAGMRGGRVSLMAVEGVAGDLMARLLTRMTETCPDVQLQAETGSPAAIIAALSGGTTDLGIAFSLDPPDELRRVAVANFPVGVIMPANHALAGQRRVRIEECIGHKLILPTRSLSLHRVMEPMLRPWRDRLDVVLETGSIELTNRMVAAGAGLAFQSRLALEFDIQRGALVHVPLADPRAVTDLGVYVRDARWLPPALERLIAEIRATLQAM
ncbi:transcriptional regulator, LysR family [Gluconacetobacter diazotrophicus PA1 5]|uniref:LysR family transcriptional regulator n=2 Tax=Gluconacetobacter diazotrophicus TaxID=33996 RepID=A0A7W4I4X0_GLUDI|nr:LysR family transcriptional regulator [Gluconacetobacter diazotrophicus]ACI50020.1 transcriptional regulator, LysR family [Gluconacetobacter diazotrophicus PA1 5]MBB2156286.1 LysR family transcriptional regulator [Gluconacetobacter diazotrophicus]TWB07900.1 DNA-binding transcriptional LysR family regulator [Gluconacetobacter diazotrophicus]CAP55943.1 putative transcriptional regulator, LysR family [Gluconacetobacter diazotrophicus PA1 5]